METKDNLSELMAKRQDDEQPTPELSMEERQARAKAKAQGLAQEHILQFFQFQHLQGPLAAISEPFCNLAQAVVDNLPRNPERTVCLRKLLEAKDAAVRAFIAG